MITAEISPFLYNWVESFPVGCTAIHTHDLKTRFSPAGFPPRRRTRPNQLLNNERINRSTDDES